MENQQVTRIDGKKILHINRMLERELPPLEPERYGDLKRSIERDGLIEPLCYWHNPETDQDEIIDGHHRFKIAEELGILYDTKEIDFTGKTISHVKYWMHVHQSGRRGGSRNLARMAELQAKITGKPPAEVAKQVAQDAGVTKRAVDKAKAGAKLKVAKTPLERIIDLLNQLSDDDRASLKALI